MGGLEDGRQKGEELSWWMWEVFTRKELWFFSDIYKYSGIHGS